MIVIAIIVILAAILVPNFMRMRDSARVSTCMSNTKNIATSLENYSADHDSSYPDPSKDKEADEFVSGYLGDKVIRCPARGCGYDYGVDSSDTAHYTVACQGGLSASNFYTLGRTIESANIASDSSVTLNTCGGSSCGSPTGDHKIYIGGEEKIAYPATDSELGTGLLY